MATPAPDRRDSVRILAKTLTRQLREQGYDSREIVALATELLGEVTAHHQTQTRA